MILSDISEGIGAIAGIGSSAVQLHQTVKYFMKPKTANYNFTFYMPETAKLLQHVELRGTAPPGIIYIYSQTKLERITFPYPSTGEWFTGLYFTVVGEYEITAVSNGTQQLTRKINITD